MVGVSDPNSQAGHQGLVDPVQFAKANQAIQMACQNLVDLDSSPSQVHELPSLLYSRNVSVWGVSMIKLMPCHRHDVLQYDLLLRQTVAWISFKT